jgi:hypothetical protein
MASSERIERFFDELGQRGHEPLLTRFAGTGRFEVLDDGATECWQVGDPGRVPHGDPGSADRPRTGVSSTGPAAPASQQATHPQLGTAAG